MNVVTGFPKGSRVQLTATALVKLSNRSKHPNMFTVVGWSNNRECVRVVRDGMSEKTTFTYHAKFLEKAP